MDLHLPCKETNQLEGHQGAVRAVRFNYDGNYCLTCGGDKLLKLWNPHRGVLLKTYSGHGYEVLDAVGSSDNSRLASCGADKTVVQWDVATGQIMRRFRGHTSVSVQTVISLCIYYSQSGINWTKERNLLKTWSIFFKASSCDYYTHNDTLLCCFYKGSPCSLKRVYLNIAYSHV